MHRSVALFAFLALSWSQVVALGCDMATGAGDRPAATASPHHAAAMQHAATATADQHAPDQAPPVRHGQGHGGDHGCQMIMSCGYSFVRHAQSAVITRFPRNRGPGGVPHRSRPRPCRTGGGNTPSSPHRLSRIAPSPGRGDTRPPGAPETHPWRGTHVDHANHGGRAGGRRSRKQHRRGRRGAVVVLLDQRRHQAGGAHQRGPGGQSARTPGVPGAPGCAVARPAGRDAAQSHPVAHNNTCAARKPGSVRRCPVSH